MQRYSSTGRVSSLPSQSGSSVLRIQHRLERDRNAGILRPQHIHRFAKRILTRVHESDALFRVDDPDSFHSPLEVFLDLRSHTGHPVVRRENFDRKERRRGCDAAANVARSALTISPSTYSQSGPSKLVRRYSSIDTSVFVAIRPLNSISYASTSTPSFTYHCFSG